MINRMAAVCVLLAAPCAVAAPPPPPSPPQTGAEAPPCFGSGLVCTRTEFGVILTKEHDPKRIDAIAQGARARFKQNFGVTPPASAFVEDDKSLSRFRRVQPALAAAGYAAALPWPAPSVFQSALNEQDAALGKKLWYLPGPIKKQAIDKVKAEIIERVAFDAIAHEYGHFWLVSAFWGEEALKNLDKNGYGGPSADWLDETAAVLTEPDTLSATRRDGLLKARKSKTPYLTPLAIFLSMPHPTLTSGNPESRNAGKPRIEVSVSGGGGESAQSLYYVQCWAFAQFLIETSGKQGVFGAVAASAARGETIAQWLSKEGAQNGLPKTVSALDAQWRAWLDQRYPK